MPCSILSRQSLVNLFFILNDQTVALNPLTSHIVPLKAIFSQKALSFPPSCPFGARLVLRSA